MNKLADTDRLLNGLAQQFAELNRFIHDLQTPVNDFRKFEVSRGEVLKRFPIFGQTLNQVITAFKTSKPNTSTNTAGQEIDLIKLADELDRNGQHELADELDKVIQSADTGKLVKFANYLDDIGQYSYADMLDNTFDIFRSALKSKEEEPEAPLQPPHEGSLSTRYCPDHNGSQTVRIAEFIYQCPLDGKIYDYSRGYTNYKGQKVMGGSVKEQTPPTADWGGIPLRIYDSRQNIINRTY